MRGAYWDEDLFIEASVTEYDITNGVPTSGSCPISRSIDGVMIKRGVVCDVDSEYDKIRITYSDLQTSFLRVDRAVREWMMKYDSREPVSPFDFTIKHGIIYNTKEGVTDVKE